MGTYTGFQPLTDNYRIGAEISGNNYTGLFEGYNKHDKKVIIKVLKNDQCTPFELARFKHEYEKIKAFSSSGIITVYDLMDHNGNPAIVYEQIDGVKLNKFLKSVPIDMSHFFSIALTIADTLGHLHQNGIVHGEISPYTIFMDSENRAIITDFGINSLLVQKNSAISDPNVITHILPYISPEQTGRINRKVDYRTDIYSLGILFFEMLVGVPPYIHNNPMDMIYFHIARKPEPPSIFNQAVPEVLSEIILKCMAKNADERYQSCFGLFSDIKRCAEGVSANGKNWRFPLASEDISPLFHVPQMLIGRGKELGVMLNTFHRAFPVSDRQNDFPLGLELLLVTGEAGIGKSALVQELRNPMIERRGFFLSGKHEEYRRGAPLASIVKALQAFARLVLSESDEKIDEWRKLLRDDLGENGRLIADIIPEIELIVDQMQPIGTIDGEAAQLRFHNTCLKLLRVIASDTHPLLLFIDDLQFADMATFNLITYLYENRQHLPYTMLVLSYRDTEVNENALLKNFLHTVQNNDIPATMITIEPLSGNDVIEYAGYFIRRETDELHELGALVYEKTRGNPFFINQFMQSLYEKKYVSYQAGSGWNFDIDAIRRLKVTDNVVEFMTHKISTLDTHIQNILTICACVGHQFNLETVAQVAGLSMDRALMLVGQAIQEGLVEIADSSYCFTHDRIAEAAYSFLSEDRRAEIHYRIGQTILRATPDDKIDDVVDSIVHHLNEGVSLINSNEERDQLASLNKLAAERAKSAAAYNSADTYAKTALSLLNNDCWERNYDLSIAVHNIAAETAFLTGDFKSLNAIIHNVNNNASTLLDTLKARELYIQALYAQNKLDEGLDEGLHIIKLLGHALPKKPTRLHVVTDMIKTRILFKRQSIDDLYSLPNIKDPRVISVMIFLNIMATVAYKTRPLLLPLIAFKAVQLTIKYGNGPSTAYAFAGYGIILCGALGDIDTGFALGKLALDFMERPELLRIFKPRTWRLVVCQIWYWKNHIRETLKPLLQIFQLSVEYGDTENATASINLHYCHAFFSGIAVPEILNGIEHYRAIIARYKQDTNLNYFTIVHQTVANIAGQSNVPYKLDGDFYDAEHMLPLHIKAKDKTAIAVYNMCSSILNYLFDNPGPAAECSNEAKLNQDGLTALFHVPIINFYDSLALLSLCDGAHGRTRKRYLKRVAGNQKKMKQWAHHAPMNHKHRFELVEAERLRVHGDYIRALQLYEAAIQSARDNEFIQDEALACERTMACLLGLGHTLAAFSYFRAAVSLYEKWGASAKVAHLHEKYDTVFRNAHYVLPDVINAPGKAGEIIAASYELDLNMIVNALQAISGEIVLDKLMERVMLLVLENAGAERGALLLVHDDELYIETASKTDPSPVTLRISEPVHNRKDLSHSVINYVRRTQSVLVLNNAPHEETYAEDTYIQENNVLSILCVPLIRQGQFIGMIYLENRLLKNAFMPERISTVELLATQAAISLENALLFDKIVTKENELQEQYNEIERQYEEMESMNEELEETSQELLETNHDLDTFKQFAEASGQGLAFSLVDGSIQYANPAFCRIIGPTGIDEVLNTNIRHFYVDDSRNKFDALIQNIVKQDTQWTGELQLLSSNGSPIQTIQNIFRLASLKNDAYIGYIITDVSQLKQAENALRESQKRNRNLVETMKEGIIILDKHSNVEYVNNALCNMLQYNAEDLIKSPLADFLDDESRKTFAIELERRQTGEIETYELVWTRKDGEKVYTLVSPQILMNPDGEFSGSFGVVTDITEKMELEKRLMQAQKMEAIGNLAGGIAHDFNNLLTAIIGYSGILLDQIEQEHPWWDNVTEIKNAAERSAALTKQLLAFSRNQILQPKPLQINTVIAEMEKMLAILIGEDIMLEKSLGQDLYKVLADKGQVEQTILNLCVNSRDAMPAGGTLAIETRNVVLGESECMGIDDAKPGSYVRVMISDTGTGIDERNLPNIFDPFFTTKEVGKGTGLGLSVVYGIVKQHDGFIKVKSKKGKGSQFAIYFPSILDQSETLDLKEHRKSTKTKGNGEVILIVEDQIEVKKFAELALRRNGYEVFSVTCMKDALALFENKTMKFDLVFSDVVLPDGNGTALVELLKQKRPDLKVLLTSGYSDNKSQPDIIYNRGYDLLQKPYTLEQLIEKISEILDQ